MARRRPPPDFRELRRNTLLQDTDDDQLMSLLQHGSVVDIGPDTPLLTSGQSNHHMYLLLAGKLSVHLGEPDSEPIAYIGVGELVGELSIIDRRPTCAHVISIEDCRLLKIDEQGFWALVSVSHQFAIRLMRKLAERIRANNNTVFENNQLRQELEKVALYDALTGIHNRRWLDDTLPRLVSRHHFAERPMCLAMIDVDHFKKFNDDHGHAAGDAVLKTVAKTLHDKLRPTDLVARYGGEEFVIMLPETDLPGAHCALSRILKAVQAARAQADDGTELPEVTISVGLGRLEKDQIPKVLLKACDAALYSAKHNGRNRIECVPTTADAVLLPTETLRVGDIDDLTGE